MANTKVQSEQIEDGSITADKLADGTIVAAELANNAVVTAAINADAVTGAKIADDAIDSEHYTDGSIDTAHIADSQITVGKMAANSVDSDQYVDGSIDTVHIADLQVTTAKIANGNISTAKIADNAVTSAKIDTNIDIAGTFDVTGATVLDSTLSVAGISTLNVSAIIKSAGTNDTPADLSFWHTDASIASGDDIAVISAEGSDSGGSPPYQGAKITFDADANWDTGTSNYYPTNINFFTQDNSGTDTIAAGSRLTIQSDGKVGIGTASPQALLDLTVPQAKTVTSGSTFAELGKTNESTGYAALQCEIKGGASAAVRKWEFQTIEQGVANAGIISFQPSGGNVGIGTTSPSKKLAISDGGAQGIELSPQESGVSRIFSYNRSSNAYTPLNIQGEYLTFGTGTSNAERWRIDSNGHFKAAANGYGINFDAAQGGAATSTVLDDYEEGSWTPSFSTSNSNGAFSVTVNYAKYIKVGGLVHVSCYLSAVITDAGSGAAQIGGLPFTSTSGQGYSVANFVHTSAIVAQPSHGFAGYVTNGHTYVRVVSISGAPTNISFTTGNPLYMMMSATYHSV